MELPEILPILRDTFGGRVEVVHTNLLKEKMDYRVWKMVLARPDVDIILKLGGPRAEVNCQFERVAAIHNMVRAKTSVPVAEVYAADESCQRWPWCYLVKEFIPGEEWASVIERGREDNRSQPLRAALGRMVAELHQIRFAGFGAIGRDGSIPQPLGSLEGLRWHAGQIIQDLAGQAYFWKALDARAGLFAALLPPALAHEDLHGHNVLLRDGKQGWEIASLVDFEKAWAGQTEADLARMELWGMTGPSFWQAYQAIAPLEAGYPDRRPLYLLLWCLEYARNTPSHLRDTQSLCRVLGLPLITGFTPLQLETR